MGVDKRGMTPKAWSYGQLRSQAQWLRVHVQQARFPRYVASLSAKALAPQCGTKIAHRGQSAGGRWRAHRKRFCVAPCTRQGTAHEGPLLGRVSDAGRLRDGAACSAAGVRNPPRKETALKGT